MRKGQVFTIDLFNAYAIFMVVLLVLSILISQMFITMVNEKEYDEVQLAIINAQDYLCMSEKFTQMPYDFDEQEIGAFFAQTEDEIKGELNFERYNYSVKVVQINGNVVQLEAGEDAQDYDRASILTRIVRYKEQDHRLVVKLWKRDII